MKLPLICLNRLFTCTPYPQPLPQGIPKGFPTGSSQLLMRLPLHSRNLVLLRHLLPRASFAAFSFFAYPQPAISCLLNLLPPSFVSFPTLLGIVPAVCPPPALSPEAPSLPLPRPRPRRKGVVARESSAGEPDERLRPDGPLAL